MELETLSGYSEAALAVLVLGVLVLAAALLSYFVVAPEYEKRLSQQFADLQLQQQQLQPQQPLEHLEQLERERLELERLFLRPPPRRMRSLGTWDVHADSSEDEDAEEDADASRIPFRPLRGLDEDASDGSYRFVVPARRTRRLHQSLGPGALAAAAMHHARSAAAISPRTEAPKDDRESVRSAGRLTHRRKSESDALKEANVARAAMLRRRVLLRKLEEEIEGAKNANEAQMKGGSGGSGDGITTAAASTAAVAASGRGRRIANGRPEFSDERLQMLLAYPADCEKELAALAAAHKQRRPEPGQPPPPPVSAEVKAALRTAHDVLALHLSVDHRDMNKVTVFCNSLLKFDGLNHLRALEAADDADVRALANAIIEKAVPAIWH